MWSRSIRYEIQECLGEGSQGRVFKVLRRDPASGLEHTVAAKILHSRTAVELWKQEFDSLARVRSPYCVQVLAFERINGRPALILEYVDGVSLFKLAHHTGLAPDEIDEILAQAGRGLEHLHARGLFHGDLSPHNILINRQGEIRLLDFGLANSSGGDQRVTPDFASPERLNGTAAGLASDLFALGRLAEYLGHAPGHAFTPCLHFDPESRRLPQLEPCPQVQKRLALKVNLAADRLRRLAGTQTQTQNHRATQAAPARLSTVWLIRLALLSSLLGTSGATLQPEPVGVVQIRTHEWYKFSLNGREIGYSPLTLPLPIGRGHVLRWKSARGRGVKHLVLKPGQIQALGDRDFLH